MKLYRSAVLVHSKQKSLVMFDSTCALIQTKWGLKTYFEPIKALTPHLFGLYLPAQIVNLNHPRNHSNTYKKCHQHEKSFELMGDEFVFIVTPADYMCKNCTSLLIHMDKLIVNGHLKAELLLEKDQRNVPGGLTVGVSPIKTTATSYSGSYSIQIGLQQKKRLFRCQICSKCFFNRYNCLDQIHKDHNQPTQSSSNGERVTEDSHPESLMDVDNNQQDHCRHGYDVK
eukprot:XP_016660904.1 PREDICTED: uncharacterized protein LOC100575406 [Acyrthosiphon pisum]